MTNAKSSNIIYGIFIVFTMLVIGIILAFKGTKERESSSVDYDNSLSVGGYAVKINNCIYFTDTTVHGNYRMLTYPAFVKLQHCLFYCLLYFYIV